MTEGGSPVPVRRAIDMAQHGQRYSNASLAPLLFINTTIGAVRATVKKQLKGCHILWSLEREN